MRRAASGRRAADRVRDRIRPVRRARRSGRARSTTSSNPSRGERLARSRCSGCRRGCAPLRESRPPDFEALLDRLAQEMRQRGDAPKYLRWIKASVGNAVRMIPIEQVLYLRSDAKYTAGRVGRRRGADSHSPARAGGCARPRALRAGPPLGDRQPDARRPLLARPGRLGRDSFEGAQRASRGQPQLRPSLPPDVTALAAADPPSSRGLVRSLGSARHRILAAWRSTSFSSAAPAT